MQSQFATTASCGQLHSFFQAQLRILAACVARGLPFRFSALCNERAWGMPGAQCTRSLVRAMGSEYAHEYSQRVHRISPAFPHAMVYGL
jgi:hypothetical protein